MSAGGRSWFIVPAPNPLARVRLFCVPYAGSGASCFHPWSRALTGTAVEVRPVQLPGRENRLREQPFRAMAPLVAALADQVEPLLDRPYCIFGHSMGALIAFELVRELRQRGLAEPARLFASGASAPQIPRDEPPLHALPDDEFVRQLTERYQGIPKEVLEHRELLDLVLPTLRADLAAIETYVYRDGPPLACGVSAFAGDQDSHVTPDELSAWSEVTSGPFESARFAGDHFYLHERRDDVLQAVLPELRRFA